MTLNAKKYKKGIVSITATLGTNPVAVTLASIANTN